jgi:hypothetical protein
MVVLIFVYPFQFLTCLLLMTIISFYIRYEVETALTNNLKMDQP